MKNYQVEFDVALTMVDFIVATSEEEAKEKFEDRINSYRDFRNNGFAGYVSSSYPNRNGLITHAEFAYDDYSETLRVEPTENIVNDKGEVEVYAFKNGKWS